MPIPGEANKNNVGVHAHAVSGYTDPTGGGFSESTSIISRGLSPYRAGSGGCYA